MCNQAAYNEYHELDYFSVQLKSMTHPTEHVGEHYGQFFWYYLCNRLGELHVGFKSTF